MTDMNLSSRGQQSQNGETGNSESLTNDLGLLRDDITKLTESVANLIGNNAGAATGQIRDAAGEAYTTMSDAAGSFSRAGSGLYDDVSKRMDMLGGELTTIIQRAPLTALAVAAAVGMVYGRIRR